jgi:hypothetical protein
VSDNDIRLQYKSFTQQVITLRITSNKLFVTGDVLTATMNLLVIIDMLTAMKVYKQLI